MKRKGVTPVIAIILLLLIVVVMIGGVFAWMTVMQEDIEGAAHEGVMDFIDRAERRVEIVTYSCDEQEVSVYNGLDETIDVTLYYEGEHEGTESLTDGQDNVLHVDGTGMEVQDGLFEVSYDGHVVASRVLRCE